MKYIKRILMLPFAIVIMLFHYSILWVKNGGELLLFDGKPIIKPEEFYRKMCEVNEMMSKQLRNEELINN